MKRIDYLRRWAKGWENTPPEQNVGLPAADALALLKFYEKARCLRVGMCNLPSFHCLCIRCETFRFMEEEE
jgi:hypothetical protein